MLSATCKLLRGMMHPPLLALSAPWIIDGPGVVGNQMVVRLFRGKDCLYSFDDGVVYTRFCPASRSDSCPTLTASLIDPRTSYQPSCAYDSSHPMQVHRRLPHTYEVRFGQWLCLSFSGRTFLHRETCSGPRDNNDFLEYEVLQLERINGARLIRLSRDGQATK